MKIENVAKCFASGKPAKCHNAWTDGKLYRLHGNLIAENKDGIFYFNWRGYYTRTTANHLNHIHKALKCESPRFSYARERDNIFWGEFNAR